MRQKVFSNYFLAICVTMLCILTAIMMIMTFFYNNHLAKQRYETLEKTVNIVSEFTENSLNDGEDISETDNIYYIISSLAGVSDIDVYLTDNSGIIKVCSCEQWGNDGSCEHSASKIDTDILKKANAGMVKELSNLGFYKNPQYACISKVYTKSGGASGFVVSTSPLAFTKSLMINIGKLYLLSAIIPIILMLISLYGITYKMTKPLKMMSVASKAMANGDFSKRIPVTSDDEIGELAISFNQMTNSLARLEETRKSFVANISHELKTPMTTIGGFIDGIIDGTIEPEKQNYYLEIVSKEIKRLSRMVHTMLDVARLESGEFIIKPERFNFKDLLLSIVISQEQRIENKKLEIIGLDSLADVTVNADKDLIHRVVYNLVDNAVKFTDENGKIEFDLKFDSKRMIFKIKNSGKGIKETELPYVFERFYKTDKSRSANKNSTGLGLYIVKTIVNNHGGTISVSSKVNEFTAFEVTLPLGK